MTPILRLVIISHTTHYKKGDQVVGWGPTVREIDALAQLFDEVIHVAPMHDGNPPISALPYESNRVFFRPVSPAGGQGMLAKMGILFQIPAYLSAIQTEFQKADVIHVRCPANISLIAILLLGISRSLAMRWIKYAGNWKPEGNEPMSYSFQRWFLRKNGPRGFVTVNGQWPGQEPHVRSFRNPCLTDPELKDLQLVGSGKKLEEPIRLLSVGRLEEAKGVGRSLKILSMLRKKGISANLDLVGDGPQRQEFQRQSESLGITPFVKFHGWVPRNDLDPIYGESHFIVMPTVSSEGWPKVLSEAMAAGAVPLSSNVSCIPQYLKDFQCGRTFPAQDMGAFVEAVEWYVSHPSNWKSESENGMRAAGLFTYTKYLEDVSGLLQLKNKQVVWDVANELR